MLIENLTIYRIGPSTQNDPFPETYLDLKIMFPDLAVSSSASEGLVDLELGIAIMGGDVDERQRAHTVFMRERALFKDPLDAWKTMQLYKIHYPTCVGVLTQGHWA